MLAINWKFKLRIWIQILKMCSVNNCRKIDESNLEDNAKKEGQQILSKLDDSAVILQNARSFHSFGLRLRVFTLKREVLSISSLQWH